MQSENESLQKRLKAKEELEAEQQKLIDQLRSKVVVSSTVKEQNEDKVSDRTSVSPGCVECTSNSHIALYFSRSRT